MQLYFKKLSFFLFLIFVFTQCAFADTNLMKLVGDMNIAIPIPSGFVVGNKELNEYYENVTSESDSRFLAVLSPIKKSQSGIQYSVLAYRDTEKKQVSEKYFSKVRDFMRANMDKTINLVNANESVYQAQVDKARRKFNKNSKSYNMEHQSVGKQEVIGIFADMDKAIGWLTIQPSNNTDKDIPLVSASVIVLVKGKIINLYVHRDLHSASDLVAVKNDCTLWLGKIFQSNK